MYKLVQLFKKYKQLIYYVFFGLCTTAINILVYWIFYNQLKINNVASNIVAWFFSCLFAFVTNKLYVFSSKSFTFKLLLYELITFYLARALTGALDVGFMYLMVDKLQLPSVAMKVVSNVIVIILNYIFSKLIIFRKKQKGKPKNSKKVTPKKVPMEDKFYLWWNKTTLKFKKWRSNLRFDKRFIIYGSIVFILCAVVFVLQFLPYTVNGLWYTYPMFGGFSVDLMFCDLSRIISNSLVSNPYFNGVEVTQPPFTYVFSKLIYLLICGFGVKINPDFDSILQSWPFHVVSWLLCICFCIVIVVLTVRLLKVYKIKSKNLTISLPLFAVLCGPMLCCCYLANHFMFCLPLLLLYFILIQKNNTKNNICSILCLSLMISFKTAFAIFLLFPLFKKRYLEVVLSIASAGIIYLISFAILGGPYVESIKKFIEISTSYLDRTWDVQNISISGFLYCASHGFCEARVLSSAAKISSIAIGAVTLISCFLQKEDWKRFSLISCILILVPGVTMYYYALILLVPLIILFASKHKYKCLDIVYIACIILVITPILYSGNSPYVFFCVRSAFLIVFDLVLIVDTFVSYYKKQQKKSDLAIKK